MSFATLTSSGTSEAKVKTSDNDSSENKDEIMTDNNKCSEKSNDEFKPSGVLLEQGAESRVYKSTYNNIDCIIKYRFPKKYRHPLLDKQLRKKRTKTEVKALKKCKALGISVPNILKVIDKFSVIYLQFISHKSVKLILKNNYDKINKTYKNISLLNNIMSSIGNILSLLHSNNIIHGDLTTSNMLCNENNNNIIMIDFGLTIISQKDEDMAVDLYVLERAFVSTHPNSQLFVDKILECYVENYEKLKKNKGKSVIKRLETVRMRGRKRSMIG